MLRLRRAAVVCLLLPNSLAIPACGSSADSSSHCLSRLSRLTQLDASRRLWFFRTPLSAVAAKKNKCLRSSHATNPSGSFTPTDCSWSSPGSKGNSQGTWPQSVPIGLCEHPRYNLCVSDLLRGCSNQWRSLQIRLGEYQRWVLQKEERPSRHSLIPNKKPPHTGRCRCQLRAD